MTVISTDRQLHIINPILHRGGLEKPTSLVFFIITFEPQKLQPPNFVTFPVINLLKMLEKVFIFFLIIIIINWVILYTDFCIAVYSPFYGPKANQLLL